jgi:glutamate 5-kinase
MGTGGMITKVLAAKRAAGSGASTVIAWGREPDVLLRLAAGEAIGTALVAGTAKMAARKQWIPIICRCTARCASMPARWPS